MALHILKITSDGLEVEWLSQSRKNYWYKKVFAVSPVKMRFYAAELVYQAAQFNELEKLNDWQFMLNEISAQVSLTRAHSRILTRCVKARWYWQWLKNLFQEEDLMGKNNCRPEAGTYGLMTNKQNIVIGCYASDGTEKFCGQEGCTMAPGTCAASGPAAQLLH